MAMLALFLHDDLINALWSDDTMAAASGDDSYSDGVSGAVVQDFGTSSGGKKEKSKGVKKRHLSEAEKEEAWVKRCGKWRAAARKGKVDSFGGEVANDDAASSKAASSSYASSPRTKKYCHPKSGLEHHCYTAQKSKVNAESIRPYRGVHKGQSAVLFCTGPTLDAFKLVGVDEDGNDADGRKVVTIGVNTIVLREDVKMDYVFIQDRGAKTGDTGYLSNKREMDAYEPGGAVRGETGGRPGLQF